MILEASALRRGGRSEPGGERVGEPRLRQVPHPGHISVGPNQNGGGSGDRPECRKLPSPGVFGVDQLNPICPRSDVEAAGLAEEPTATDDVLDAAGIAPEETIGLGEDPYAAAADSWAAGQPAEVDLDDDEAAARRLYDLALEYQERSQRAESRLLDDFEQAAAPASNLLGELVIVDDDDERLVLSSTGEFRAEVVPEDAEGEWRSLTGAEQLVEFYDPTDVFGDLADALAEAYPTVAPELVDATDGTGGSDATADIDASEDVDAAEDDETDAEAEVDEEDEEGAGPEGRPTA